MLYFYALAIEVSPSPALTDAMFSRRNTKYARIKRVCRSDILHQISSDLSYAVPVIHHRRLEDVRPYTDPDAHANVLADVE